MEDGRLVRPAERGSAVRKGNELAKPKNKKPDWQMSGIIAGPVEDYLYSILPPRDEVLAEMELP
jgi:hypothetical protein